MEIAPEQIHLTRQWSIRGGSKDHFYRSTINGTLMDMGNDNSLLRQIQPYNYGHQKEVHRSKLTVIYGVLLTL
jgi:hypothetical protein